MFVLFVYMCDCCSFVFVVVPDVFKFSFVVCVMLRVCFLYLYVVSFCSCVFVSFDLWFICVFDVFIVCLFKFCCV